MVLYLCLGLYRIASISAGVYLRPHKGMQAVGRGFAIQKCNSSLRKQPRTHRDTRQNSSNAKKSKQKREDFEGASEFAKRCYLNCENLWRRRSYLPRESSPSTRLVLRVRGRNAVHGGSVCDDRLAFQSPGMDFGTYG